MDMQPCDQAAYLSMLWHRLAAQHIALGCACAMSGVTVTLEDFERDIADHFLERSEREGMTEVIDFLLLRGPLAIQPQPVRDILQRLSDGEASSAVADWLLPRMSRTLQSYAELHGPALAAPLLGGSKAWRGAYRGEV
ncbi:hypothetical protein [Hylemonella gracilis]|uniref:Uncharacterized protein n=1 Tax=Hylemonella gracilis ATCC 19624 TaxID=887062 RepID=F3KPM6_9BURK|nr:hypothetical protein [Hylemonella gracilis]EGI78284.1 hypothetical protein HGR_01929 [Hylemonella gracilis ATCC 19624]